MSMKRETYRYIDTNYPEKRRWLDILTMQDGTKLVDLTSVTPMGNQAVHMAWSLLPPFR